MKTIIYSCGGDMTSEELLLMLENDEDVVVDTWFPECGFFNGMDIPLTRREIIAKLPKLIGTVMVTVSETIIVMFQREVRLGRIRSNNIELWCGSKRIRLSNTGEMIDYWDGGFFEEIFDLRFH